MSLAMLFIKKNALLSVTMLGEIRHLTQIIYGIGAFRPCGKLWTVVPMDLIDANA